MLRFCSNTQDPLPIADSGGMAIYEMRALVGLEWNDEDVTTVGGYVVRRLGHLPRVGEQLRIDGYIVTVEQADVRRVQQLSLRHGSQVCAIMLQG